MPTVQETRKIFCIDVLDTGHGCSRVQNIKQHFKKRMPCYSFLVLILCSNSNGTRLTIHIDCYLLTSIPIFWVLVADIYSNPGLHKNSKWHECTHAGLLTKKRFLFGFNILHAYLMVKTQSRIRSNWKCIADFRRKIAISIWKNFGTVLYE